MLNNLTKKTNLILTEALPKNKLLIRSISKLIFFKENSKDLTSINKLLYTTNKKAFADKSTSEDLIEQILLSKTNDGKKTFVAREKDLNSGIYSKNNSNYNNNNGNGNNYSAKNSYSNNNNNYSNGNSNFNNNSNGNGYQSNNYEHMGDRELSNLNNNNQNINNNQNLNNNYNQNSSNYNNGNMNNTNNNQNNNNQGNYNNSYRKRHRISIIRDGMNIISNLRRVLIKN